MHHLPKHCWWPSSLPHCTRQLSGSVPPPSRQLPPHPQTSMPCFKVLEESLYFSPHCLSPLFSSLSSNYSSIVELETLGLWVLCTRLLLYAIPLVALLPEVLARVCHNWVHLLQVAPSSRAPSTRRLYALKWRLFPHWCDHCSQFTTRSVQCWSFCSLNFSKPVRPLLNSACVVLQL